VFSLINETFSRWRLFELLGTGLKFSARYHHQTNGQAERVNKTMEEALRIFVQGQPKTWPQRLGMFEFAYNSSWHSTTGMAPFQLLYGEIPHTQASLIHGPSPRIPHATAFAEGLMSSQLAARDAIQQANRLFRERHAQARRGHVYLQGEEVLLSSEHLSLRGEHPKFFPKFQRSVHLSSRSCVEQYGGAANSPAHPVRPHRYGCQYRSPTALQAAATSTRFI